VIIITYLQLFALIQPLLN